MSDVDHGDRQYDPDADHPFPDERLNEVLPAFLDDSEVSRDVMAERIIDVYERVLADVRKARRSSASRDPRRAHRCS